LDIIPVQDTGNTKPANTAVGGNW